MKLVRYNPFREIDFFGNTFNDFFNDSTFNTKRHQGFYPAVDISTKEDTVILSVELPGVSKEDISVNIEDKVLTVKGQRKHETEKENEKYYRRERSFGSFKRSFSLSDEILTDEVSADYKDGILKITLKKNTAKEEVKQITIN